MGTDALHAGRSLWPPGGSLCGHRPSFSCLPAGKAWLWFSDVSRVAQGLLPEWACLPHGLDARATSPRPTWLPGRPEFADPGQGREGRPALSQADRDSYSPAHAVLDIPRSPRGLCPLTGGLSPQPVLT